MSTKNLITILLAGCLLATQMVSAEVKHISDVIYGRKDGMALTYDVIQPENANGAAIIFMMSGGWYSSWTPPSRLTESFGDMLEAGFTMIPVYHGSAPKYKIPDAVKDVNLATLHIKENAEKYVFKQKNKETHKKKHENQRKPRGNHYATLGNA